MDHPLLRVFPLSEESKLVWEEKLLGVRKLLMEWRFWMVRFILWVEMAQSKILLKDEAWETLTQCWQLGMQ